MREGSGKKWRDDKKEQWGPVTHTKIKRGTSTCSGKSICVKKKLKINGSLQSKGFFSISLQLNFQIMIFLSGAPEFKKDFFQLLPPPPQIVQSRDNILGKARASTRKSCQMNLSRDYRVPRFQLYVALHCGTTFQTAWAWTRKTFLHQHVCTSLLRNHCKNEENKIDEAGRRRIGTTR